MRIIGGGTTGALAVAQVENGLVTNVAILNPGSGYTNTPVIVIAPPFIPQPRMSITALSQLSFSNLAVGANYQLQSFNGGNLADVGLPFTATNSSFVQMILGTVSTNQYRLAVTPVPRQAQATAQVAGGFVVGATLPSGGSGYITAPVVSILGAGSNATAIAYVNGGSVTNITITSPGIGYVNGSTIVIAPPQAMVIWPNTVSQVVKLDVGSFPLGSLSPYDNCQLEFMPVGNGTWANVGSVFVPTSATHTLYIPVTGNTGFFRIVHLPNGQPKGWVTIDRVRSGPSPFPALTFRQ